MKLALGIFCALLIVNVAQAVEPIKVSDGMYHQQMNWISKDGYQVDTVAQLCFVTLFQGQGIATVPCANLAKRPEWQPIITWVKPQ